MEDPAADQSRLYSENDVSLLLALSSDKSADAPPGKPSRKRASTACMSCRARKVRCDVTLRGAPCMNCRLDNAECVVAARPSKYRKSNRREASSLPSPPSHVLPSRHSEASSVRPDEVTSTDNGGNGPATGSNNSTSTVQTRPPFTPERVTDFFIGQPPQGQYVQDIPRSEAASQVHRNTAPNKSQARTGTHDQGQRENQQARGEPVLSRDSTLCPVDALSQRAPGPQEANVTTSRPGVAKRQVSGAIGDFNSAQTQDGCVPYTQYAHFVKADDFSQVSSEDVDFLRAQGAFQLPAMPALGEFVQEYFRHVHPHLPLIDEKVFWDSFQSLDHDQDRSSQISLFTFQTMLFACSNFVKLDTLQSIGFRSSRHARKILYRRSKLLFDLDGQRDFISTAQGTLLLSYSPDNHNRKINTYWLGVSIRFAKDANAHQYHTSTETRQQNARKRLWWCCILRDRILPLGVRRSLYITHEHFNFASNPPLTADDLGSEIHRSEVYGPAAKQSLAELCAVLCELAVTLTDVIMIVYPVSERYDDTMTEMSLSRVRGRIGRCKSDLAQWYESASVRFPIPAGLGDADDALILYTDLMYIYYHTARIALCHHEVLLADIATDPDTGYPAQLRRNKRELQESVASMTDIMKELLQLKLMRYSPLSLVAYSATPLVLHVLDVKLSTTRAQWAMKQRRLQIFMEAMQMLQSQYDGTDRVSDYLEKLVRSLAADNAAKFPGAHFLERRGFGETNSVADSPSSATSEKTGINDWGDVFLRRTNCYLRIVTTVDLSFSKGEFPEESDFPANLSSSKLTPILPLYRTDVNTRQEKDSIRPVGLPSNGEPQRRYPSDGANASDVVMYHPTPSLLAPDPQVNKVSGGSYPAATTRMSFDQPYQQDMDMADASIMNDGLFKDFNLDSWISDVLPTLTGN